MAKAVNNETPSSPRDEVTRQRKKRTKPGTKAKLAVVIPPGFEVDYLKVQQLEAQRQQGQDDNTYLCRTRPALAYPHTLYPASRCGANPLPAFG